MSSNDKLSSMGTDSSQVDEASKSVFGGGISRFSCIRDWTYHWFELLEQELQTIQNIGNIYSEYRERYRRGKLEELRRELDKLKVKAHCSMEKLTALEKGVVVSELLQSYEWRVLTALKKDVVVSEFIQSDERQVSDSTTTDSAATCSPTLSGWGGELKKSDSGEVLINETGVAGAAEVGAQVDRASKLVSEKLLELKNYAYNEYCGEEYYRKQRSRLLGEPKESRTQELEERIAIEGSKVTEMLTGLKKDVVVSEFIQSDERQVSDSTTTDSAATCSPTLSGWGGELKKSDSGEVFINETGVAGTAEVGVQVDEASKPLSEKLLELKNFISSFMHDWTEIFDLRSLAMKAERNVYEEYYRKHRSRLLEGGGKKLRAQRRESDIEMRELRAQRRESEIRLRELEIRLRESDIEIQKLEERIARNDSKATEMLLVREEDVPTPELRQGDERQISDSTTTDSAAAGSRTPPEEELKKPDSREMLVVAVGAASHSDKIKEMVYDRAGIL